MREIIPQKISVTGTNVTSLITQNGRVFQGTFWLIQYSCSSNFRNVAWLTSQMRYHIRTKWLITMTSLWTPRRIKSPASRFLLNRLIRSRSRKTSKLRVTGLCTGNSPGTGKFPAQRDSNAEIVSIWWRHHVFPHFFLFIQLNVSYIHHLHQENTMFAVHFTKEE